MSLEEEARALLAAGPFPSIGAQSGSAIRGLRATSDRRGGINAVSPHTSDVCFATAWGGVRRGGADPEATSWAQLRLDSPPPPWRGVGPGQRPEKRGPDPPPPPSRTSEGCLTTLRGVWGGAPSALQRALAQATRQSCVRMAWESQLVRTGGLARF